MVVHFHVAECGHGVGMMVGKIRGPKCLIAGTQVLAQDETGTAVPVAIETVEAGDLVWSRDEHTGEQGFKVVVETYVRETDELVHLSFTSGAGCQPADGSTANTLIGTAEHPFWSLTRDKWVDMGELNVGEQLSLTSGTATVTAVRVELLSEPVKVYNFQVADWHTYYAAPEADKPFVWVHNANGYGTRSPKSVGEGGKSPGSWTGKPGNSVWQSTDAAVVRASGDGNVRFRKGYPVFDRTSEVRFKKGQLTGDASDFGLADAKLANQLGGDWSPQLVKKLRQGKLDGVKYTWHHHQNGRYMQLVPRDLHDNIPHTGGASRLRNGG